MANRGTKGKFLVGDLRAQNGARFHKIAKVTLVAGVNTGGGAGAWKNPESGNICVDAVFINVKTAATGTCLLDIGTTATSATTLSDNLADGVDVHTAAGLFNKDDQAGANGKSRQKLASGKWVTISAEVAGSDTTGLVADVYIRYFTVD